MKTKPSEIKYKKWKKLINRKVGIKSPSKQLFEVDKIIRFITLLNEIEQENLKLKQQINGDK